MANIGRELVADTESIATAMRLRCVHGQGRRDIVLKGVLKRVMCRRIARWIITRRNKRQARMNWKWIFANKGWLLEVPSHPTDLAACSLLCL